MEQRKLGTQGLKVSSLGYGAMGVHSFYGPSDEIKSFDAIRTAYDNGVNFFDTAEMYGWGENEKFIGKATKEFRHDIVIATKFGFTKEFGLDSRPSHIRDVVNNSLVNMGVDYIDVLYQHRFDPNIPIEDVVGTMKDLVKEGKIKYLGLCEVGPEILERANAIHPISILQTEFSLFAREAERLFPILEKLGIGFVAYSPLARGFLTGGVKSASAYTENDYRRSGGLPWWESGNYENNLAMIEQLKLIASDKGMSISQLALAWILSRNDNIVAIPGSRNSDRVLENLHAAQVILDADDLAMIDAIIPNGGFGGRGEAINW